MKGVIMAAGYGTRFLPATKTIPKEMFPLIDKPAIAFIVEEFIASGITEILIITSRRKKALEDYFDREVELETVFTRESSDKKLKIIEPPRARITFVRQQHMHGTGDALLLAEDFAAGEQLCIAYPDDLVLDAEPLAAQVMRASQSSDDVVLAVMGVPEADTGRYGIINPGENNLVKEIIEKPAEGEAPSCLAVIGRYIISPDVFPLLHEEKARHSGGEFFHINAVNTLAEAGRVRWTPFAGERLDIGEPAGYVQAIISYALHHEGCKDAVAACIKKAAAGL